jgi:hypothetical protein
MARDWKINSTPLQTNDLKWVEETVALAPPPMKHCQVMENATLAVDHLWFSRDVWPRDPVRNFHNTENVRGLIFGPQSASPLFYLSWHYIFSSMNMDIFIFFMFYDFVKENHYCKDCIQQTPTLLSAFLGSAPYANKMQTNNNISHFHRRRWPKGGAITGYCTPPVHFFILFFCGISGLENCIHMSHFWLV